MKLYFAPMEGVTGYIYRNVFDEFYGHGIIDKYFMPFISPNKSTGFRQKEINDILPEHNQNKTVIPQILTNQVNDFNRTVVLLQQYGYSEINLNLGCPSGTVVSKKKGAGFLSIPNELDAFLDEIFEHKSDDLKISIKTRIGLEDPSEFEKLLQIYNQYPLEELIIHPRVQKDYYKNLPNMQIFQEALQKSNNKVCYNGNLFNATKFAEFIKEYPETTAIMLGRGFIGDPGLTLRVADMQNHNDKKERDMQAEKARLKEFHDRLLNDYQQVMSGDMNAIYKMKEIWFYMKHTFAESDKYSKQIKKAQKIADYKIAVSNLFDNCELNDIIVDNF